MSVEDISHVVDILPAFVLDALTEEEMHQVSEHLAVCGSCRAELTHLQAVADELPLALSLSAPSPALKRKLMQSIHSRGVKPSMQAIAPTSRQSLAIFLRKWSHAITLALIILLVATNLFLWRQLNLATQATASSMRVVALSRSDFSPDARGTLVINPSGKDATLVVADLVSLSTDKQYQVWLIKGAERVSGGVFSVDQSGYASFEIKAPKPFQQYDAIGISVEPAGGSRQPTGPNVFQAQIPQ